MIKSHNSFNEVGVPTNEDLALINKYSLKPLTSEEVFVFSVILCDNEIDRDFEKFSVDSLNTLKELFVGKTGILNHSMRSEDQGARTFRTQVLSDNSRKTLDGESYTYLKAWCYTVRSEKNNGLIRDIESGIKKEVSISCSAGTKRCSVCGKDICSHARGNKYKNQLCFKYLENITDAYEWSFVAVPAQKNAGVTKGLKVKKECNDMEEILKSLGESQEVCLDTEASQKLFSYISQLKRESLDGKKYREFLNKRASKLFALALPQVDGILAEGILKNLNTDGLEALCQALETKKAQLFPSKPQIYSESTDDSKNRNNQFKF